MKKIATIAKILLFLVSPVFAQAPNLPTQQVSGCDSLLKLDAPKEITLNYEEAIIVPATVLNVRCSASHVYIDIENIRPDIYFTLNPDFYQSVLPGENVSFSMTFPPGKVLNKTEYTGIYWIRTNNKWFNSGEVKITVAPLEEKKDVINEKEKAPEKIEFKIPTAIKDNKQFSIAALLLLIGIFGGAYYYFKGTDNGNFKKTETESGS